MNCFSVVSQFEEAVAKFSGSKYAVAVNTGTSAIFLSLQYVLRHQIYPGGDVVLPAHTFVSVPMAVLQCGKKVSFSDYEWKGVYKLFPFDIWDGALRFKRGMYLGGLHCLSFQARKLLNIGEGGMILTDNQDAYEWLKKARYWGRPESGNIEDIEFIGWQMYMTPEKAARGLHLLEYIADDLLDQEMAYPDLRKVKAFRDFASC